MCQIEKFGASPFRYVRTDIEVHGEERVLTVHNRAAIPIITKRFACYDTPSFYSPVRKEPRDKKQKNKKTERYRTDRAKPTIERQKRGRKSGNRKPSRNRKNGAITDTPTPTPTPTPLPSLPDFSDTSYEMFPNRQKKTPQHIELRGFLFSNP